MPNVLSLDPASEDDGIIEEVLTAELLDQYREAQKQMPDHDLVCVYYVERQLATFMTRQDMVEGQTLGQTKMMDCSARESLIQQGVWCREGFWLVVVQPKDVIVLAVGAPAYMGEA